MSHDPAAPEAKASVLIVDDEADNRELLEVIFAWAGFNVTAASSGKAALASVALHPPDIILLDVMMPNMDGYEATAALRALPASRDIPVVLVSAFADSSSRSRGLAAGANEFLTKPVDRVAIVACVRRLVHERQAQPGRSS